MEYDDGIIACTAEGVVIRRYYPWLGAKKVPYQRIRTVQRRRTGKLTGRWRIWGSGDLVHWYNCDWGRPRKPMALVLKLTGHIVQPVITPDDSERVVETLLGHGVQVTDK
jgi:hypothetical protein